jgi:hypothetical protein
MYFIRNPFVLASVYFLGTACSSRTATFNVTRPAMLNAAAVGNTMSVGQFAATNPAYLPAAQEFSVQLQHRIVNSLNPAIRLVTTSGGVEIRGLVLSNDYSEQINRNDRTCSRQVENGRVNGVTQYRTENYSCADLRRVGSGVSRVQFTVVQSHDGRVIFDQVFEHINTITTTGLASPYNDARQPAGINPDAATGVARGINLERFARVILPWREAVTVEFEDCNGDAKCRQAYEMIQQGNLAGAEPLFTEVIGQYTVATMPVPPADAERVGEALFNRGLVRQYMGRYAQSVGDLSRAIQLRPDESDWQSQLEGARQMAQDQEALRQQGAVTAETQNVQRAGTP